jgi:hypothetical protein
MKTTKKTTPQRNHQSVKQSPISAEFVLELPPASERLRIRRRSFLQARNFFASEPNKVRGPDRPSTDPSLLRVGSTESASGHVASGDTA